MCRSKLSLQPISRRSWIRGASAATALTLAGTIAIPVSASKTFPSVPAFRTADTQKITFWILSFFTPDDKAPIYDAVKKYKDATGVEVTLESASSTTLQNKLITAVKGGQGPDIVSIDSAWNAGLAAAKITTDITDRFAGIASQFFKGPVTSGSFEGKQFAAPWYTNNVGLFYNKGMFASAGVSAPPTTWDELVSIGKKLTGNGKYGLMLGAKGFGSFLFWPFAFQNGATLISDDGTKAEFGNTAGLEAWKFYSDLYLTDKIVPDDIKSANTSWDQVFAPFIQERAAMVMSGDWAIGAIKAGNPKIDFAVAPLPKGKEAATIIGGYNLGIPTTSKNVDAAWAFIEWLTAVEQEGILQSYNRIQARADIVGTEYARKDANIQVFIEQSSIGRARASVPAWDEIENTVVADAWDSVILGQASPDEAMSKAVSDTNDLLAG